jgi:hypothetical protein
LEGLAHKALPHRARLFRCTLCNAGRHPQ